MIKNKHIIHNGKTITLIQEAYVDQRCGQDAAYYAMAEDSDGVQYEIMWEISHSNYSTMEDESNACDWENPSSVEVA